LFLISALGSSADGSSVVQGVALALAEAAIAIGVIAVVGRLVLNTSDPEDFLYALRDARVGPVD